MKSCLFLQIKLITEQSVYLIFLLDSKCALSKHCRQYIIKTSPHPTEKKLGNNKLALFIKRQLKNIFKKFNFYLTFGALGVMAFALGFGPGVLVPLGKK